MNDMISLDILCGRYDVSMDTAKACLRADGVPIHTVLVDGSKMTLCEENPAAKAIARQRQAVAATAQAQELAAAIVERLAPRMGEYLEDLMRENTRAVLDMDKKTQRVVDTVIQQAENIVGMLRKTNGELAELRARMVVMAQDSEQSVRWNNAMAISLKEVDKVLKSIIVTGMQKPSDPKLPIKATPKTVSPKRAKSKA